MIVDFVQRIGWKKLLLVSLIFIVFIVGALSLLATSSSKGDSKFENEEYSIEYPAGFEQSANAVQIVFTNPDDENEYITVEKNSTNVSVNEELEQIKVLSTEDFDGLELANVSSQELEINGNKALRITNAQEETTTIKYYVGKQSTIWLVKFTDSDSSGLITETQETMDSFIIK